MEPKTAVVTGGASGMGRIYALRMAERGTQVAVIDRTQSALDDIAAHSPNIFTYPCDVTDRAQVQVTVDDFIARAGPIDRLAHCAAIFPTGRLDEQSEDSIHHLMRVNYGGTVNLVRAVLPAMQERDSGEIVIFGSIGGAVPVPGCGAYCATKAAVGFFTETLIEENRDNGVHIMLLCPPLVDTPLLEQATATGNPAMVRDSIATRRFADPAVIIDAVDRGLARKTCILYPGAEAKGVAWLRRFSPRLVWKILRATSRDT